MPVLEELREGLLRKRLVRRRGSKLLATAKGRKLAGDPIALLYELALDLGGGDLFTSMVADVAVQELRKRRLAPTTSWLRRRTQPPSGAGVIRTATHRVSGVSLGSISDVVCRGEAYGLVERKPRPRRAQELARADLAHPRGPAGAR